MRVAFFGHADTPEHIRTELKSTIINLINEKNADTFYVGHQGNFDRMAANELKNIKTEYPFISFYIVLAYFPDKKDNTIDYQNSIFPEEIATVPKKFAIAKRNDWMIKNCDTVVSYVTFSSGGAAKYKDKAEKKGKEIINLATERN